MKNQTNENIKISIDEDEEMLEIEEANTQENKAGKRKLID